MALSYMIYRGKLLDGPKPYTMPRIGITLAGMSNATMEELAEIIGELQTAYIEMAQNAAELRTQSIKGND